METGDASNEVEPREETVRRHVWVAILLSLLFSGLGVVYAGRLRRGLLWMVSAAGVMTSAMALMAYLPHTPTNVILGFGLLGLYLVAAMADAVRLVGRHRTQRRRRFQYAWVYLLLWLGGVLVYTSLLAVERAVWLHPFHLSTAGMADTIWPGERFIADRLAWRFSGPRRGDVVTYHTDDGIGVQRIIGLPGDVIELRDEVVYLNGTELHEPYATLTGELTMAGMADLLPVRVPAGQLFLMGDHRRRSYDSRFLGCIPMSDIFGKARVTYLSIEPKPFTIPHIGVVEPAAETGYEPGEVRWARFGKRLDEGNESR